MSDTQERTEKATPRKIREASRKGRLGTSKDLSAWLGVGAAGLVLGDLITASRDRGIEQMLSIGIVIRDPQPQVARAVLADALGSVMAVMAPMLAVVMVVAVVGAAIQGGVRLRPFTTSVEQFNIVNGAKRLFGLQAWWEGGKALLKTVVVGGVLAVVIAGLMPFLASSAAVPLTAVIQTAVDGITSVLRAAVVVGIALAIIDVIVVARRNRKHTRMTMKELKDETKNTDGDPLLKAQRRARQLALSRNRMLAAVADADVVVVNPIHVAVALRYEPGRGAPRVVAKGRGLLAARIRERGTEHGVALVKDVPLARAVYAACDVGAEIPAGLYDAVARVLALVMALERSGGVPRTIIDGAAPAPGRTRS